MKKKLCSALLLLPALAAGFKTVAVNKKGQLVIEMQALGGIAIATK